MTIEDYEQSGGFKKELSIVREIGERLTTLQEMLPARPHRLPEIHAMQETKTALNMLREEIAATRNT